MAFALCQRRKYAYIYFYFCPLISSLYKFFCVTHLELLGVIMCNQREVSANGRAKFMCSGCFGSNLVAFKII